MNAKFKTFLMLCLLVCGAFTQLAAQPGGDCIECLGEPINPVCVEDADGNTIPFPNACFAECEGYTSDDFVECDSTIFGGGNDGGDCIECLDEPFDLVCVEDADGNIIPFPNACFAECEGYTSDDFVECDLGPNGGGDNEGDCIECLDEPFEAVCVEDADGNIIPFLNACFAECEGFTSDDFVECDLGEDECHECHDEPFDPVCVEDADGNIIPFPNACFAECEGFTSDDFVECDLGPNGGDCIECLDEPLDPVCVEIEPGLVIPFPNACFAECEGYTSDDFVECDSTIFGGGDCDTTIIGGPGSACLECLDEPFEPVCVEVEEGVIIPFPNACTAECEGFTEDDFVECDFDPNGGGDNEGDCFECHDEPFDPVCVEDADGEIFHFPNLCFAECEGFTEDDLVECDFGPNGGGDCIECIDEPLDPVCVEVEPGLVIPFPNLCFAECEGYTEDDLVDCDPFTGGDNDNLNIALSTALSMGKMNLIQNPVTDYLDITYDVAGNDITSGTFSVVDLNGKVISQTVFEVFEGRNRYQINVSELRPGLYLLNLETPSGIQAIRFVK